MTAPLTLSLIALTAYVTYRGLREVGFQERFLLDVEAVLQRREWRRIFTALFLHADWQHFGMNMLTLWFFGRGLEPAVGGASFLLLYFGSGLGANLAATALHHHQSYRALGASGATSGVVMGSIFLLPGGSLRLFFVPVPIPAWIYALLFVALSLFAWRRGRDHIAHDTHLAGALIGQLLVTAFRPACLVEQTALWLTVFLLPLAAGAVCLFWGIETLSFAWLSPRALAARWQERARRRQQAGAVADAQRLDRLLEKVSRLGLASLSAEERRFLDRMSRR